MQKQDIKDAIDVAGYVHIADAGVVGLVDILDALGEVVHVEEIVRDERSKALVKSADGIAFHTDHHRARFIVWVCFAQSSDGGATLIVDGRHALSSLKEEQRQVLREVQLSEHAVFRSDVGVHPMLVDDDGVMRVYWSLWLAREDAPSEQRLALDAFDAAVRGLRPTAIAWKPGDVVVVDNSRMLHGRTPIVGDGQRHLRRYWVA